MKKNDPLQSRLLRLLQKDFPLVSRPFQVLAEEAGLSEEALLGRVEEWIHSGLIRRLSATFDSRSLGYTSALVAAAVEGKNLDEVVQFVNRHPGVTHNYERLHTLNLWFTVTAASQASIDRFLDQVRTLEGVWDLLKLPAVEYYKLNVSLDPETGENRAEAPAHPPAARPKTPASFSEKEKALVRAVQNKIPLHSRPFEVIGQRVEFTEEEVLSRLSLWKSAGIIRKVGAVLNHRRVGTSANALVVWLVPEKISREVGLKMAAFPQVSHCYRRTTYPNWPYSHYTMIHARDEEQLGRVIQSIAQETGIEDFLILKSGREFKKAPMRYFEEDQG